VTEAYYPRHSELDTAADVQADALQARVRQLETLLREVAEDYVGRCHPGCQPGCLGGRIRAVLRVKP
jgi:hypothetical protein